MPSSRNDVVFGFVCQYSPVAKLDRYCDWRHAKAHVAARGMQTARSGPENARYQSICSTVNSILRQEGLLGFFAGIRTKILQSVLAAATMFLLKERLYELTAASVRGLRS